MWITDVPITPMSIATGAFIVGASISHVVRFVPSPCRELCSGGRVGARFCCITGRMLTLFKKNWFLLGLVFALILGGLLPGAGDTLNPDGRTQRVFVFIFFFMVGFTLPSEQILHGIRNVKLHVTAQLFIFLVIPLYFAATAPLFQNYLGGNLLIGLYALAVLPTTLSTSNIFTQTSGGNTVGTMFNAALSNTLGIIVSPLLLSAFLAAGGAGLPPEEILSVLMSLGLIMLTPFIIGQILRRGARVLASRLRSRVSTVSSLLLLSIVFFTISSTADDPEFLGRVAELPVPFLFLALSHFLFIALAVAIGRVLRFSREDRISLIYLGPQKTMVVGVPLLSVYFAGRPDVLAFAILPLLFYHPFQILIAGVVRGVLGRSAAAESEKRGGRT